MRGLRRGRNGGLSKWLSGCLLAAAAGLVLGSVVAVGALAQSSVRPPDNAVNVDQAAGFSTAGGSVRPPADAVTDAPVAPGQTRPADHLPEAAAEPGLNLIQQQGTNSLSSVWGALRHGAQGTVSIPDRNAATLVQDTGMTWLTWRAKGGPLQLYGGYALGGMVILLVLFYLLRGKIRIEGDATGTYIERFKPVERFGHWLMAGSFILLALTGLNLLYGKDVLIALFAPTAENGGLVIGGADRSGWELLGADGYARAKEVFAAISIAGKWVHNNVAWAFMAGLALVFVMWVVHNIPSRIDLIWLAKGGGLFAKGVHPPSRKFNAGQKLIFWATILLGASISLSGISLLFPYEAPMFAKTFVILNSLGAEAVLGYALPETLTPMQEMQYAQIWHSIVSLALIVIIIAHIYIGSVGMEGAFDAMGSGMVDRQWAEEHHGLWVEEEDAKARATGTSAATTPAE